MAGTAQDFQQADWIRQKFLEFGLDQVNVVPYKVLLSYPKMTEPNKVFLLDSNGQVQYNTSGRQPPLYSPEESSPLILPNFSSYSGTGTAQVKYCAQQYIALYYYYYYIILLLRED